jgi:MacB-like protein
MLGVRAAQGRVITPNDDRTPSAHPVAVISDRLSRMRFNADPQTLGRLTYLKGNPFTIIGILPASFTGTVFANETDFWAPLMMEAQLGEGGLRTMIEIVTRCAPDPTGKEVCGPGREAGDFRVLGRLKPDVTPEVASAQLTAIAANVPQVGPEVKPPKLEVVGEAAGETREPICRKLIARSTDRC